MNLLYLFLTAMAISSIGFLKFVWFISIGYGFSVAAIGILLLCLFYNYLSITSCILAILLIIYGLRLGGYLMYREIRSGSYQATMKNEIKDGSDMHIILKVVIWISCALLYVCEVSPVFFRIEGGFSDDIIGIIGMIIMLCGIVLESSSDIVKNNFKKQQPHRFCDVKMFRIVRCPNYLGEVLTWTGAFISGIPCYHHAYCWILAIIGYVCIVYIMFGGARRLEIRQNKNYGKDPEYQQYVKSVPILIPFVPLYSVEKYKWLVG